MHRVQRASERVGDKSVGINLFAVRPLRTALGPRREMVASSQPPELVDQDPAHERTLAADHREHRPPGGVDGAAGLVEEGPGYPPVAHGQPPGRAATGAAEELERPAPAPRT